MLGNFSGTDNFVLYTENLFVDDGYTEVSFRVGSYGDTTEVSEPGTLAVLGIGVVGLAAFRRRRLAELASDVFPGRGDEE